jgi:hypothetical protein
MDKQTTTIVIVALTGLVVVGAVLLLTQPKPENNDISWEAAAKLFATYYGAG